MQETARRAAFRSEPMIEGFLSCALQDLQFMEMDESYMEEREERDSGTIYTCPDETFCRAVDECARFRTSAGDLLADMSCDQLERAGADLYLERAGHGAGFSDRPGIYGSQEVADSMSSMVQKGADISVYFGDDGQAYFG